jgi:hypothetical protein
MIFFVVGWLSLFALLSILVANPFQSEPSASATPVFGNVMFLHGLLIGMVGLMALLACQVLGLRSMHVRTWIVIGVLVATVFAAVGGIWDKNVPGYEVPMWTQIVGFFALDEILLTLLVGFAIEWRRRADARTLPFVAATLATVSMFFAAIMGHLAGWILEFGWNTPGIIASYAKFAGFGASSDFSGALTGSHSHEMVVAAMALTATLFAYQFGYPSLKGIAKRVARFGMLMISAGVVIMTGIYLVAGFNSWAPPPWFVSGANGIASDDVITGVFVMGGGLVLGLAMVFGRYGVGGSIFARPLALAGLWSWILSFATVVIAGYAIEMNTTHFGAGNPNAPGAKNDALFTWLHQDIGLFLLPSLVLVMLVLERLVHNEHRNPIAWTTIVGTSVAFVGGMIWVFIDPALHGPGYLVTTLGLLLVGAALMGTLWWGAIVNLPWPAGITTLRFSRGLFYQTSVTGAAHSTERTLSHGFSAGVREDHDG